MSSVARYTVYHAWLELVDSRGGAIASWATRYSVFEATGQALWDGLLAQAGGAEALRAQAAGTLGGVFSVRGAFFDEGGDDLELSAETQALMRELRIATDFDVIPQRDPAFFFEAMD